MSVQKLTTIQSGNCGKPLIMAALSSQSWMINRYARFVCIANEWGKGGEWKNYDDSIGSIVMTLTDAMQLIISQNSVILESHSLVRAQLWMRGLSRNDSLLFMYKFKAGTRRFRIRFSKKDDASGIEVCTKVIQQLSVFFPIKTSPTSSGVVDKSYFDDKTKENNLDMMHEDSVITNEEVQNSTSGEVTLAVMTQTILTSKTLPLAYHQHQENLEMIPQLVRMCLGDPTFPAFVESVEDALKAIVNGNL